MLVKILEGHVSHINNVIKATQEYHDDHHRERAALADCLELMDLSRDRVTDSIKALGAKSNNEMDINAWLSAVLTNYVTCLDLIQDYPHLLGLIGPNIEGLISRARAILAIHVKASANGGNRNFIEAFGRSRRSKIDFPSWLRPGDRKLLEASGSEIVADVVVAKDGSGNFTTVGEAVAAAPNNGKTRHVIYVKEGVYDEIVEVGKKKKNIMIVGDGMDLTIITGRLNVVDYNVSTFRTSTLTAVGDGFILQDICIQNTAGPEKHQAVALRVGADRSVIHRCKILAYQDTLYAHSLRQFYRHSSIWGTVDFIFGNAAVVLQSCELVARKPMDRQNNMVTAQGRTDPNQNTGTSIQYCNIVASPDLTPVTAQFATFLGRPWKEYSRTVVMQSFIGDHIDPKGWSKWTEESPLDNLYYGEYQNYGPGANTFQRVNWTSFHNITDSEIAKQFTVREFIQGQEWLDDTGVEYVEGLEFN